MFLEAEKRKFLVFGVIFAVFAIIIIYLLFFTAGLKFSKEFESGKTKVFIENESVHLIRNIKIFANEELLQEVLELKPGEKSEIILPASPFVKLSAQAPFHSTITTDISISNISNVDFKYSTSYPKPVLAGFGFELALELCNNGDGVRVNVNETHDKEFFEEGFQADSISVAGKECKTIKYNLTPLKKGETLLSFNIKSENFNESFEQTIQVD